MDVRPERSLARNAHRALARRRAANRRREPPGSDSRTTDLQSESGDWSFVAALEPRGRWPSARTVEESAGDVAARARRRVRRQRTFGGESIEVPGHRLL